MTATATFTSYKTRSDAKRGFGRKFKDGNYDPDTYLVQEDGKWGFNTENGVPVLYSDYEQSEVELSEEPAIADKPLNSELRDALVDAGADAETAQAYAEGKIDTIPGNDAELQAALQQHDEDGNDVAPSAFGRFAVSQLTAEPRKDTEPTRNHTSSVKPEKDREERNDVKRPSAGTLCAQVWDIATQLSNGDEMPKSKIATLSEVVKAAVAKGINQYTARTQYARWRVFHGITGRH